MNPEKAKKLISVFCALTGYGVFVMYTGAGIPCLFRYFFHVPCPGCGITHMLLALAGGDLRAAFCYHPVVFAAGPFLLWILYRNLRAYLTDADADWRSWEKAGMMAVLALLLVFWAWRIKNHV